MTFPLHYHVWVMGTVNERTTDIISFTSCLYVKLYTGIPFSKPTYSQMIKKKGSPHFCSKYTCCMKEVRNKG